MKIEIIYGEKCKIFTHARDAIKFIENIYG